jgi:valyl-tRNA synthetase
MDKKYNHLQSEAEAQAFWQEHNVYSIENNPGPLYSVDTPPPTVSGSLHIGHIFSYTQTDIIARYKRMSGFSVFYPFGFDDNGLPTERFVEKKLNVSAHSMSRSAFINLCLQETASVEKQFEQLWQRMGLSVDWRLSYSTIDERTRKISQASFIELYKKGYVYRKNEPALYCPTCRTTVAQAELEDVEKASTFNDIIFTSNGEQLIIGTTRPELLPAVVAVLYNPRDTRYTHLKGRTARVPLFGQEVPILEDPDADPEKGTGLVMVSTFGDKMDIQWFKRYNLPYLPALDLGGKFLPHTGPLAGLKVPAARETVLKLLQEQGLLVSQKPIVHAVNVHERCKKEIEYLMLPQWFLALLPYKSEFLRLGDEIEWYPAFMKARYKNWVENINWDWCLSRQRFYGIPFPAWHCTACGEILLAELDQLPVDPQEQPYDGFCPKCPGSEIKPDTDVMDTWNTSSLTPYICASLYTSQTEDFFNVGNIMPFLPMSMRPQAHDIIRTWAFYTIVKSWMHNEILPWYTIVISGHVLSTEKEKISKSRGNAPLAPESLLATYPADALRYWTASGSLGYDIAFSENQLSIGQKLLIKLWNAFRFAEPYLEGFTPSAQTPEELGIVNEWLLDSASKCFKAYIKHFQEYEFSPALAAIEEFFWHSYCDNYLELIKDQLMNSAHYKESEVYATKWTLHHVGLRVLQMYAPFIPHITETIYKHFYQKQLGTASLHQTKFDDHQTLYTFASCVRGMETILAIVTQVRKLKSEHQLSLKTEIEELIIYPALVEQKIPIDNEEALIKGITHAHTLKYGAEEKPAASYLEHKNDRWYAHIVL